MPYDLDNLEPNNFFPSRQRSRVRSSARHPQRLLTRSSDRHTHSRPDVSRYGADLLTRPKLLAVRKLCTTTMASSIRPYADIRNAWSRPSLTAVSVFRNGRTKQYDHETLHPIPS